MFILECENNKKLHLFDTFEGLPETDINDIIIRSSGSRRLMKGRILGTIEEVKENLKDYNNVYYYKGIFPNTSEPIKDTKFSFVHLDTDLYKSTIDSLNFFYSRINNNGIILIHDYEMCTGVKRAITDFLLDKVEKIVIVKNQCYIVKLVY